MVHKEMRPEVLAKLHGEQVEMLKKIDAFCRTKNLKYYLIGGTLLGAIRHSGFIPWDDDIDIAMPRSDYEVFIKEFENFAGDKYFVQTALTDKGYGRDFAKVRINNTVFLEEVDAHVQNRHHGIFLDVFVLENRKSVPSKWNNFKFRFSQTLDSYIVCKRGKVKQSFIRRVVFSIFPIRMLIRWRDNLRKGNGDCYWVAFLGSIKKEQFDPAIEKRFEELEVFVPKEYDAILTKQYGEYMTLPPIEKRVTHNPVRISFDLNDVDEEL